MFSSANEPVPMVTLSVMVTTVFVGHEDDEHALGVMVTEFVLSA